MGFASIGQVIAIHTVKSKAGLSDEEYRDALSSYGVNTSKELIREEASDFIKRLSLLINDPSYKSKCRSKARVMPFPGGSIEERRYYGQGRRESQRHLTDKQAERIEILEIMLGWNLKRTAGFIKRQIHKTKTVEMLMNYQAVKVITGMTKVYAGSNRALFKKLNRLTNHQLRVYADDKCSIN